MKTKRSVQKLYIVSLILGLISIYSLVSWIFVHFQFPELSHQEKQSFFYKRFMFDLSAEHSAVLTLSGLILGAMALFILIRLAIQEQNRGAFSRWSYVKYFVPMLIVFGGIFLQFWGML